MTSRIRTIHWGTGAMGGRALAIALGDPRFDVVGVVSTRSRQRAQEALDAVGVDHAKKVVVGTNLSDVFAASSGAEVVVLATQAHIRELEPQIAAACRLGMHVVCIGEEALHPASADSQVSQRLSDEAIRHGVAVVGTGVNPGFLMDALPLALTAPTRRWSRLYARRVSDLSSYGWTVLQGLGIGLDPLEFESAFRDGRVVGHLGFVQSVAIIAEGLGVQLLIVENVAEPIVRQAVTPIGDGDVSAGRVIGVSQRCVARSTGGHVVVLEHPQRIGTSGDDEEPFGDVIEIDGDPSLRLRIEPGIDGGTATVGLLLNMIPGLFGLAPGLHSTSDVPIAALGASRRSFSERPMQPATG